MLISTPSMTMPRLFDDVTIDDNDEAGKEEEEEECDASVVDTSSAAFGDESAAVIDIPEALALASAVVIDA